MPASLKTRKDFTLKFMSLTAKYRKALVTGGAGFIGSHLVTSLLEEGLEVISLDDYSAGKSENLDHVRDHPGLREVRHDVTVAEGLDELLSGVDLVFHQACGKMTICLRDPARDLEVNGKGTLNMLIAARDAGVKRFVHASTGSVYGEARSYPTDEEHSLNPTSFYGVSKLAGEKYARAFHHLYGMETVMLRYFHVFGPRQENSEVGGVVSIFARLAIHNQPLTIFGTGEQLRSFTYVDDLVEINKLVALKDEAVGQAYNCASGVKVTIQELADAVLRYYGKTNLEIQYTDWKPGDIKYFDVDNSKIKALGFDFQYSFEEGLKRTLDWSSEYFGQKTPS